uniref:Secreted protein n=1 Tax=Heterorhabditis bacteriophora TaxID=37862 RepID=A0A1I7WK65_HETBA
MIFLFLNSNGISKRRIILTCRCFVLLFSFSTRIFAYISEFSFSTDHLMFLFLQPIYSFVRSKGKTGNYSLLTASSLTQYIHASGRLHTLQGQAGISRSLPPRTSLFSFESITTPVQNIHNVCVFMGIWGPKEPFDDLLYNSSS